MGIAPANRSPWRWMLLLLVGLLVIAFVLVPLININRYHRTVSDSLSRSLGHPVHLGSVQLQVLPHTGLAVTDFVVEENPGFGAEPILRAPTVLVTLRLSSLWGGHIEASRIDLDNASVNLVRDSQGQLNFNSLLLQAAHSSDDAATRAKAPRPPYIEFRAARINFKTGLEKKAFSFLNSDLSIWQENPGQWQFRFEGQPARTDLDLDLADTGLVRLAGSLNRAASVDSVPLKLHAEWSNAPLGQVSRMLLDDDSGWRGLLTAEADFSGDLDTLQIGTRFRVLDAHRQEFTPLKQVNMDARCRAVYRRAEDSLDNLTCLWPAGDGHLLLTGNVRTLLKPQANLALEINHTPAASALSMLGVLRRGITASLNSNSLINGHFTYTSGKFAAHNTASLSGEASVDPLVVNFPGLEKPLDIPALRFATPDLVTSAHARAGAVKKNGSTAKSTPVPTILLSSASLPLGSPAPVVLSGAFTPSGFQLRAAGQADLVRLAALARSSGLLGSSLATVKAVETAPAPPADVDLTFAGAWLTPLNSTVPLTTTVGSLRIQHAQAKFAWLPEPVEIDSATANFAPDEITWSNAAIAFGGIAARGSFTHAVGCPPSEDCNLLGSEPPAAHFDLDVATLDLAALQSALTGASRKNQLLNAILSEVGRKAAPWPPLDGTVRIGTLTLAGLTMHGAKGDVRIRGSRLNITSLEASTLGGSVDITGNMDAGASSPAYSLNLNWTGIAVPQIAAIFHEKWGAGTMSGKASVTLAGYTASDLAGSARGTFKWDWTRGSLGPAVDGPATLRPASLTRPQATNFSPARFSHWQASGTIAGSALKLEPSPGTNPVTGTVTFERAIDLSWPVANGQTLRIGGTLASPDLEPATASPTH